MATYRYYCAQCDEHTEITKPMSQCNDPELCADCRTVMKRLYTPIAAVFKGGGWGGQ